MKLAIATLLSALAFLTHPTGANAATPCTSTPTTYTHVIVWMLENHSFSQTRGHMPYLDSLANQCAYFTNEKAITHPSLPNYIALTSGSTHGITSDGGPGSLGFSAPNVFEQMAEPGWRSWHETMPTNCRLTNSGTYIVHHNPATYYENTRAACNVNDVPITRMAGDLKAGAFAFGFVVPNNCHIGHKNNCPGGGTIQGQATQADNYLKSELPVILNSALYQNRHTLVLIVWDEGKGTSQVVYTVAIGPSLGGQVLGGSFTHYSILRLVEDTIGAPCLLNACSANKIVLP